MRRRGMREIQARKERLNLGKEKAARAPLDKARKISLILIFKDKHLKGFFISLVPDGGREKQTLEV